jgi:hypothetical protein
MVIYLTTDTAELVDQAEVVQPIPMEENVM